MVMGGEVAARDAALKESGVIYKYKSKFSLVRSAYASHRASSSSALHLKRLHGGVPAYSWQFGSVLYAGSPKASGT